MSLCFMFVKVPNISRIFCQSIVIQWTQLPSPVTIFCNFLYAVGLQTRNRLCFNWRMFHFSVKISWRDLWSKFNWLNITYELDKPRMFQWKFSLVSCKISLCIFTPINTLRSNRNNTGTKRDVKNPKASGWSGCMTNAVLPNVAELKMLGYFLNKPFTTKTENVLIAIKMDFYIRVSGKPRKQKNYKWKNLNVVNEGTLI